MLCCDIKIVCEYIKTFVKQIGFWQNFKFPGLWMKVEIKIWADSSALPLSRCCYCCQSSDMFIHGTHKIALPRRLGNDGNGYGYHQAMYSCTCVKIRCSINQKWHFPRDVRIPQFLLQTTQSCNSQRPWVWFWGPKIAAASCTHLGPAQVMEIIIIDV